MVSIYLSIYILYIYHLPRVCRTLIPEIRVRPEMLRVFRYIDVHAHVRDLQLLNSKDN